MSLTIGLNIGANSIGWAVVEDGEKKRLVAAGSRVLPVGADKLNKFAQGESVSNTAERTELRKARRRRERFCLRRERLLRVLNHLGFIPSHYAKHLDKYGKFIGDSEPKLAWMQNPNKAPNGKNSFLFMDSYNEMQEEFNNLYTNFPVSHDWTLYYLRRKAICKEITKEELAWVLLSFLQKRGYTDRIGYDEIPSEEPNKKTKEYFIQGEIVNITKTNITFKDTTLYIVELEDGLKGKLFKKDESNWIGQSWIGQRKTIFVSMQLDKDGNEKWDENLDCQDCRFTIPTNNDWTNRWALLKKKTEQDLDDFGMTVGEYIYNSLIVDPYQKVLGKTVQTVDRTFYEKELRMILEKQKEYHPELNDANLYQECITLLYPNNEAYRRSIASRDFTYLIKDDIILYQRPLTIKKSNIGNCPFEKTKGSGGTEYGVKCIARSHPLYEDLMLWKWLADVKILKKIEYGPTESIESEVTAEFIKEAEDRARLFDSLRNLASVDMMTFLIIATGKKKKELGAYRWDYRTDKPRPGCNTRVSILNGLSAVGITDADDNTIEQIWHIIYSNTHRKELKKALATFCSKKYVKENHPDVDANDFANKLGYIPAFKKDYGSYSAKAVKKLLPLMRQGMTLESACNTLYGKIGDVTDSSKWSLPEHLDNYINTAKSYDFSNPIIEQSILETLRIVRDLWKKHGKIDEFHVSIDRDLTQTNAERKSALGMIAENDVNIRRAKVMLAEMAEPEHNIDNVRKESPSQLEIFRIFEEGILTSETADENILNIIKKFANADSKKWATKAELKTYIEWLKRKYRSPYTGKIVPLERLFTKDYQIEHIIPLSRYYDDSFANKVICEAEVNKMKGSLTAYEFIKNHQGEKSSDEDEILTLENYESFVKEKYAVNQSKLSRLLMENIPVDNNGKGNRNEETRHIDGLLTTLLSKIVKDDSEDGDVSKNVIIINSNVSTVLKKDWGMNDVWNHLLLPRFVRINRLLPTNVFVGYSNGHQIPQLPISSQLKKNKMDHRQRTKEAIVNACATRSHVDLIGNKEKRAKERESLLMALKKDGAFIKPWDSFTSDAEDLLNDTIISYKSKNRIITRSTNYYQKYVEVDGVTSKKRVKQEGENWVLRNPLHRDTIYGNVKLKLQREEPIKKAIANPNLIVNPDVRRIVKNMSTRNCKLKEFKEAVGDKVDMYFYTGALNPCYATRKPLDETFDYGKIQRVTDSGIRMILSKHLDCYNGKPALAFSPDGIEELNNNIETLNRGKWHQPIYKVRIFEMGNSRFPLGTRGSKLTKFVEGEKGFNIYYAVYEDWEGKRTYQTVTLKDVIDRNKAGKPHVDEELEDAKLQFYLQPNDLVYVPSADEEANGIDWSNIDTSRVYRFASSFQVIAYFAPYSAAAYLTETEYGAHNKTPRTDDGVMIKEKCVKVEVNRLGEIGPMFTT